MAPAAFDAEVGATNGHGASYGTKPAPAAGSGAGADAGAAFVLESKGTQTLLSSLPRQFHQLILRIGWPGPANCDRARESVAGGRLCLQGRGGTRGST